MRRTSSSSNPLKLAIRSQARTSQGSMQCRSRTTRNSTYVTQTKSTARRLIPRFACVASSPVIDQYEYICMCRSKQPTPNHNYLSRLLSNQSQQLYSQAQIFRMASTSSLVVCVLLLTALAVCQTVAARPVLADELTQLETVVKTLDDATRTSRLLEHTGGYLKEHGDLSASSYVAIVLEIMVGSTIQANAWFAANKLTPFEEHADAQLVVDELTRFVKAHQEALNSLMDQNDSVLRSCYFCADVIHASLVSLQGALKTFASYLLGVLPTYENPYVAALEQFGILNTTLSSTVSKYNAYASGSAGFADHKSMFLKMKG